MNWTQSTSGSHYYLVTHITIGVRGPWRRYHSKRGSEPSIENVTDSDGTNSDGLSVA